MASPIVLVCMFMVVVVEVTCANMRQHRFRKPFDYNTALIDPAYNLETVKVRFMLSCSQRCGNNARCRSFNYKKEKGGGVCQPNSRSFRELAYSTPPAEVAGFRYYESVHDGEFSTHLFIYLSIYPHMYVCMGVCVCMYACMFVCYKAANNRRKYFLFDSVAVKRNINISILD